MREPHTQLRMFKLQGVLLCDNCPRTYRVAVLLVLWLLLLLMIYKVLTMVSSLTRSPTAQLTLSPLQVMTVEVGYEEYDPFSILELESSASMAEIRKQYRRLSKIFHPDKQGGNQEMFMKIAKAYEA